MGNPQKSSSKKMKRLTTKQQKFVANVVSGKNITDAAIDAGYGTTRASACVTGSQTLRLPNVQAAVQAALDKSGATIDASAKVIADAHTAKSKNKPDFDVRLRAVEANRKWRGIGSQEGDGINGDKLSIAILIMQEREKRGLVDPKPIEGA